MPVRVSGGYGAEDRRTRAISPAASLMWRRTASSPKMIRGTSQGIELAAVVDGGEVVRLAGRSHSGPHTRPKPVKDPSSGDVIVPADTYLDEDLFVARPSRLRASIR